MNILFLIRTLGRGGAERQLTELAKGLHSYGHQVTVAVLYGGGDFEAELVETGVNVIDLKKQGFWDVLGFFYRYFRLLNSLCPDIIHGYMPLQNIVASLSQLVLPRTKVVWGLRASSIGSGPISASLKAIFKLSCWLSPWADLIISNSESGKLFHINNDYPVKLIEVVPNGIDTVKFRRNNSGRQVLRRQWGVTDTELLIGNIARLDRVKDHTSFFRACAILLQEHPHIKIVCAGEESIEYRAELELLAKELLLDDRIIWAGECTDMTSVYSALDLEVSSSLYEGFPNVVAEAMSCGLPVVATDVGDVKIMLDGVGICVPPGNPMVLANAMEDMLQNDLAEIGREGRERIVERYSVDKLVNRTESLLNGLLLNKQLA